MNDLPAEELKRLLEADRQRRMQAVQAAIQAAPVIEDGRIVAVIQIVPGN